MWSLKTPLYHLYQLQKHCKKKKICSSHNDSNYIAYNYFHLLLQISKSEDIWQKTEPCLQTSHTTHFRKQLRQCWKYKLVPATAGHVGHTMNIKLGSKQIQKTDTLACSQDLQCTHTTEELFLYSKSKRFLLCFCVWNAVFLPVLLSHWVGTLQSDKTVQFLYFDGSNVTWFLYPCILPTAGKVVEDKLPMESLC